MLIDTGSDGLHILKADDETIVMNSLKLWEKSRNKQSSAKFRLAQYHALYGLVQLSGQQNAAEYVRGAPGLFLDLLAEADSSFEGLRVYIMRQNEMTELDATKIQAKLCQIWDSLPNDLRPQNFSPQQVFN